MAGGRIFQQLSAATALPGRVYLGVGTNELGRPTCAAADAGGEAVGDVRRLAEALGATDTHLLVVVEPCATHDERTWARRLPGALRFLYQH